MKKKLFTLMTLMLCVCSGAWAEAIKVGFTSSISSNTVSAPAVTTQDHVTVNLAYGSQVTDKNKGSMYWGSTTALSYADGATVKQNRTKYNDAAVGTSLNDNVWTGASFEISSGYKFTVTDIQVDFAGQDYSWKYKLEVIDGEGNVKYTTSGTMATPKNSAKRQITATEQSIVLTGKAYVKLYYCLETNTSDSKYMYIPELYLTGTVEENVQTKYSKPSITQGAYSQPDGTYAVTLAVQNSEEGTINYTVGSGEEVTGAASGTVINVAPNTLITAYVTGSAYDNSDNSTLTTNAAPTLATPTYTISGYDLMKNIYTVAFSAAAGDITYTIGGASSTYSAALELAPGTAVEAYATQENMTQSATLSFTVPAAPVGGTATSPTTAGSFNNNESYNMGAITVPGACIAGQISSGSTPINGSIKTRTNQGITGGGDGFYVTVNPGYTVTGIKIVGCSNQTGANTCKKVYVDGAAIDFTAVSLPLAEKNGSTGTIDITGISARNKIEFDFENNYQAQMNITVTYSVSASAQLAGVSGFNKAFATFCAPQSFTVTGATAYKAQVDGDAIVLTAIEGVIPANTGVIIAGDDAAKYTLTYISDVATAVTDNDLKGVTERTLTSTLAGSITLLALNSSAAEFQTYNGTYFPANKAYLLTTSGSRQLKIAFADEATAIKTVEGAANSGTVRKYMHNGKLVIVTAKGTYNILGTQMK